MKCEANRNDAKAQRYRKEEILHCFFGFLSRLRVPLKGVLKGTFVAEGF
jgi:hypothetical protein